MFFLFEVVEHVGPGYENGSEVWVREWVRGLGTRMGLRSGYENGSDAVVMHPSGRSWLDGILAVEDLDVIVCLN